MLLCFLVATIHSRDRDHGATGKGCVGEGRRGEGADLDQLLDQRGAKPVARLQPTTGVMSHICKRKNMLEKAALITGPRSRAHTKQLLTWKRG